MNATLETTPPSLVGALSADPGLLESLAYQLNGLIVVFVALGSIWALLEVIGALFRRAGRLAIAAKKAAVVELAAEPDADAAPVPELDPTTVAAIAGAVHFVVGSAGRVISVTPIEGDWAREGRRQIFSSHKVR